MRQFHTSFEPIQNRRVRRWRFAVCSLVAVIGLFSINPTRATAACGDYLSHGSHQNSLGLVGHLKSDADDHPLTSQVPKRTPCNGPFCQQGPIQHPLSAPVVSIQPHDRWGWIAAVAAAQPEHVSFLERVCESVTLPMIAFRLDRPPKA